jgi:C-terminal peptidase prc
MLRYMDPHSTYLSSEDFARFMQDLDADYGGIGAYVNDDPDTGLFTIIRPIYSGPAYRAGLLTDDKIVRIDDWPTLGQEVDDIIKRLKGKPKTPVKLYVWRRGMDPELIDRPTEDMAVSIQREEIEIPAGTWQLLPGEIGLIELNTFSRVAMEELRKWIPTMRANGMRALVLDMRRNSGGLLTEAREVANLFLPPKKLVVTTEGRDGPEERLYTREDPVVPAEVPVVILTSRFTASAAEIVSGALQDHGRATLVGKTTFGKGSVQQLLPLAGAEDDAWEDENGNHRFDPWEKITVDHDGDGQFDYAPRIKLTIARYLLPKGRSIHRELDRDGTLRSAGGVTPDVEVDTPPIESWRVQERRRLERPEGEIARWIDGNWAQQRELFERLAVNDHKDITLYPGFEDLYGRLDTTLSRDDVRRLLRESVRRRVQDARGQEFPFGDFVEDVQVQRAIQVALEELGERATDIAEYGLVFDVPANAGQRPGAVAALDPGTDDLVRRARARLEEARRGGAKLTDEELAQLLELLAGLGFGPRGGERE